MVGLGSADLQRTGVAMDSEETVVAEEEQAPTMVAEPKKKAERKEREVPRFHVVLWDSDAHSYEYVERMLRELFGHSPEQCHQMAETVDTKGKVIVLTTTKEHAELKRDQILAYGKDDLIKNCTGSMHSTIESAG
jgi:ATP-dependent Clp protease adaptor protein ClpS